ncbi:MAG: hypothetical protein MJY84_01025 [Bacteroidales bacterium]|nr:hypothetical protein [Bacteroidales bacterium]
MKRFLIIAASVVAALTLAGCNKNTIENDPIDSKTTVDHFEISISTEYEQDVLTFFDLTCTVSANGRSVSSNVIDMTRKSFDIKEGIQEGQIINVSIQAKAKNTFPILGYEFTCGRHVIINAGCVFMDGHKENAGSIDLEHSPSTYVIENEEDKAEAITVFQDLNSFSQSFSIVKNGNSYTVL